jgi:GT2 family glycosyltransferase
MDKIAFVIPTFNRRDCLCRLLGQLRAQVPGGVEMFTVVVVDGSTDGTLEMLKSEFPEIHVVLGDGEWWWTGSINQGCKRAVKKGAEAVLLMNDDTEVEPGFVISLLEKAEVCPGAVIGSLNVTKEEPHRVYFSGVKRIVWWKAKSVRYHKIFEFYDRSLSGLHESVILMGRGLFIPTSVFDRIGFFDEEAFPQYKADVDFVLTAFENGIGTFISWDSVVYSHMGLTGRGVTFTSQGFFGFLGSFFGKNTCNNLLHSFRYYRKHCPWYLLPLSFIVDKMRLIYSYLSKRTLSSEFSQKFLEVQEPFFKKVSGRRRQ